MNETLRQALFRAGLSEDAVAARLGVDPKTVRRWLDGRLPYPRLRWQLALLLNADEADLWPGLAGVRGAARRPSEVVAIYPHRWSVPSELCRQLLSSATGQIAVLADGGLFIAGDADLVTLLCFKASSGVRVRVVLSDPEWWQDAGRRTEDGGDAEMPGRIRDALRLCQPLLRTPGAELRLHRTVLYNSMLLADQEILVNQQVYGLAAADSPVLHLRDDDAGDLAGGYRESFERIWASSTPVIDQPR